MWLLIVWAGVAALAATAVIALRPTHDGAIDGAPASGALILVVGVLALVLGVTATVGGWGMSWHGTHVGHMGVGGTTASGGTVPEARTLEVEAGDTWFDPDTLVVEADTPFNLRVSNVGAAYHDLTVATLDLVLTVEPGRSSVAGVDGLSPGSYPFECTVPGHAAAGMRGTLQVIGDDVTAGRDLHTAHHGPLPLLRTR